MFAHPIEFLELFNGQVQYVVPRWQRRYRWGQSDIERLVEDLLTVSDAGPDATHYAGNLLTFPDPGAAGVVKTIRVVDGQQRLTTVSILLGCIAEKLGPKGQCGDWTAAIIRNDRLTNPGKRPDKLRKLRLQNGDEEEYRLGLDGRPTGAGAVAQAWRIARRLVARNEVARLLRGLERLRVVSIGLGKRRRSAADLRELECDRPTSHGEREGQELAPHGIAGRAATGSPRQPLEADRAKSGRRAHNRAHRHLPSGCPSLVDGKVQGIDHVYEALRRWALREGLAVERPALCRDLARLAGLYGIVTGTAGAAPQR